MVTTSARRWVTAGFLGLAALLGGCAEPAPHAAAADPVARGELLVEIGGCHDCHTPKIMTAAGPVLDSTRLLSGHRADATLPPVPEGLITPTGWGAVTNNDLTAWAGPWGVSFTANLTPDATGTGGWTPEIFIATIRSGKHMGSGRPILPPMPWFNYAKMSDEDLRAVFAYLRSLPPVNNMVPAPIPPETPLAQR